MTTISVTFLNDKNIEKKIKETINKASSKDCPIINNELTVDITTDKGNLKTLFFHYEDGNDAGNLLDELVEIYGVEEAGEWDDLSYDPRASEEESEEESDQDSDDHYYQSSNGNDDLFILSNDQRKTLINADKKFTIKQQNQDDPKPPAKKSGGFSAKGRLDTNKMPDGLKAPREKAAIAAEKGDWDFITLQVPIVPSESYVAPDDKRGWFGEARQYGPAMKSIHSRVTSSEKSDSGEDIQDKASSSAENYYRKLDKDYDKHRREAIKLLNNEKDRAGKTDEEIEEINKQIKDIEEHTPEWLHTIANSAGGPLREFNMSAGTHAANTQMAVIENAIAKQPGIGAEVKVYHQAGTDLAEWYEYTVLAHGPDGEGKKITFEIDARREWYNKDDFDQDHQKITKFLADTKDQRQAFIETLESEHPMHKAYHFSTAGIQLPEVIDHHSEQAYKYPRKGHIPSVRVRKENGKDVFSFGDSQDSQGTTIDQSPELDSFTYQTTAENYNDFRSATRGKGYELKFNKYEPSEPKSKPPLTRKNAMVDLGAGYAVAIPIETGSEDSAEKPSAPHNQGMKRKHTDDQNLEGAKKQKTETPPNIGSNKSSFFITPPLSPRNDKESDEIFNPSLSSPGF